MSGRENDARVFLVGAGPGDPDLLTVKALRLIRAADVVVHDRLVAPDILALIPPRARRIDVGKAAGRHPMPQREINALLVHLAQRHACVVRLKGGDPLIFGRGSEEALALAEAGLACEVVPGITAAQGAAASFCLPLTHRGLAGAVTYMTGHGATGSDMATDIARLADPMMTVVVYMGGARIADLAARLMAAGRAPQTPVAMVVDATRPAATCAIATLSTIAALAAARADDRPVLFIIGDVVAVPARLAETLGAARRHLAEAAE
jgi:uroporphyrin-III C-methyltransferase